MQLLVGDFNENLGCTDSEGIHLASITCGIRLSSIPRLEHLLDLGAHNLSNHRVVFYHVTEYNHESASKTFISYSSKLLDHQEQPLDVALLCKTCCNLACASEHHEDARYR